MPDIRKNIELIEREVRTREILFPLIVKRLIFVQTLPKCGNRRSLLLNNFFFIAFLLMTFFSGTLYSQSGIVSESIDTLRINELIIHSYRPLKETGIVKSNIDSLVLNEKIARSLAEVLSEHSSVFIKSYGRGSLATASFRGTAPSHTKVTWNGMEINSPMLGMVDFSLIPVYFADEISLFHGPGSMQKTHGALGGLISLNTKADWSKKTSGRIIQGIGSYGTRDSYLKIHTGSSRFQSGTRIFYSASDNDFKYLNRDIIDSVDFTTGKNYHPVSINKNAGYKQYGILQELFFLPGDKNMLKLSFWGQKSERSIPFLSANESGNEGGSNHQVDDVFRVTGNWKHFAERLNFQYLSGLNFMDLSYKFTNDIPGLGTINLINSFSRSVSFLNRAEAEFKPGNTDVFQLSVAITNDLIDSYESVTLNGYEKTRNNGSVFLSWSHKTGERVRTGVNIGEELAGGNWSPLLFNLTGEYHLLDNESLFLRSGISRNVKFPGMNDLYFQPGGNPDLRSETALNREAGLEWSAGNKLYKITGNVNLYHSDIKNWILWLPTFNGYWVPRNIEKVEISGLEAASSLTGLLGKYEYKLRIDYAFTRSRNKSSLTNEGDLSSGKQLPFIPLHSANTTWNITRNGWSLTWIWNYFSERFINTSNNYYSSRDYLYPYFMNQLSAGKSFVGMKYRSEITLGAYNLFNEEYRSILQRPMPGRNFTLMIKIGF